MKCNNKNFPYKSFYSQENHEIYCFYRQGQAFIINPDKISHFRYETITDKDLGDMVLFQGEALIVRSSSNIYFFKQTNCLLTLKRSWQIIHTIKARGSIFAIKGNIRI